MYPHYCGTRESPPLYGGLVFENPFLVVSQKWVLSPTALLLTKRLVVNSTGSPGAAGLMAGAAPTATRAMALNFGMLAGNAVAKDGKGTLSKNGKGTQSPVEENG